MVFQNADKTITQLQYVEWSQNSCPNSPTSIVDLIEILERVQRKTANGPITIHCRYVVEDTWYVSLTTFIHVVMAWDVQEHSVH